MIEEKKLSRKAQLIDTTIWLFDHLGFWRIWQFEFSKLFISEIIVFVAGLIEMCIYNLSTFQANPHLLIESLVSFLDIFETEDYSKWKNDVNNRS